MVRRENYILIQGFMLTDLQLKGNELMVYAIIYGFSQDGAGKFTGSRAYLAEWTNSTVRGIQKNLDSLVEKQLIIKHEVYRNSVKYCEYQANLDVLSSLGEGTEFSGVVNKVPGGSEQSAYNNIDNNITDNIDDNNNIYSDFEKVIKQKYLGKKTKATRDRVVPKLLKKYSVEELTRCLDRYAKECRGREKQYIMNESTFWNGRYIDYLDCNYEDNNTGKARVAATKKPKLSDF